MTLIEVMVTLTVLIILIMIGLPSFTEALQNTQLRGASEALLNGLQTARGEAIKRNLLVQFAVGPGTGWTVTEAASGAAIQSRSKDEGSPNAVVTMTPSGATKVTFTPLGGITANLDASATITQLDISNPSGGACQTDPTPGPMRCLRVVVSGGGSLKLCDPAVTSTDPRHC